MIFCQTVFIILNILHIFLCEEVTTESNSKKKLNVVIFFSYTDKKCISLKGDTLGFLNLHEATRVKHSSDSREVDETIPETSNDKRKGSAYCKELLKNSLMTLTHYCHTVLKMKTAIASVSSKSVTNDIQEPEAPFHETNIGLFSEIGPKSKRSSSALKKKPNQIQNRIKSIGNSKKSKAKNIITSSKHTEVFKIRVKRQENDENEKNNIKKEIENGESLRKRHNAKPSWDVLDVMKHVRYSFLGKMFKNTLQDQIKADQEDLVDISKLGKEKIDPGLFSMVKSTLATLSDPPESSFIMVVFGGHLHAISDKHSPIVQSIKHVIENTDSENTLIIVSGSCAEESAKENNELENEDEGSDLSHHTMPVYAKGPDSEILSECTLLYDIPLAVRKILELRIGSVHIINGVLQWVNHPYGQS